MSSSIVDHVTEFLQSVVDGAESEAEARAAIEEAVANVLPLPTKVVKVEDLVGGETFIGGMGGVSRTVDAGEGPSSSFPGMYLANTEHGALYMDLDGEVIVLDD